MDTRFWGPSGWRLLHTISFAYHPRDVSAFREFFHTLPFVLPCKFCRTSLSEYMKEYPLEPALKSRDTLSRWLWTIHNQVNSKLRSQNLNVDPDPSFEQVRVFYEELLSIGCTKTEFPGWDFLFSIADLHPLSKEARVSVPIPGADCGSRTTLEEKNLWNCLTGEERLPIYMKFWLSLGKVLPFKEWRVSWSSNAAVKKENLRSKASIHSWLWETRCAMERDLELLNTCKYSSLCKNLRDHRSGCSKSRRARTCRKRKDK
jgi:hypothetical protein